MKDYFIKFIFALSILLIVSGCGVKKHIPENKKITSKYSFQFTSKSDLIKVSELRSILKPTPNSSLWGMYPKLRNYYHYQKKKSKLNTWLYEHYGEEPVFTDSYDIDKNLRDLKLYLANIGFFETKIDYEIKTKSFKNEIIFKITPGNPYRINEINYDISDSLLAGFVMPVKSKSLIKNNDVYNAYTLDDERDRITQVLRNSGYYYFSRNYIQFMVDSSLVSHKMNITVKINNLKVPGEKPGQYIDKNHKRVFVKSVNITTDFNGDDIKYDTIKHKINFWDENKDFEYNFLYSDKVKIKPSAFNQSIKIKPGKAFSAADVQKTYNGLFSYQIIRSANIDFDTTFMNPNLDTSWMDCSINMQKNKLIRFSIEGEGTNSSGDLGMRGNIVVLNRNIFQRAEVLRIMLNGGFEAQTISEDQGGTGIFNTFEAGIQGTVFFPRFFSPIRLNKFNQQNNPVSNLTFGFNFQNRPNYSRNITLVSLGYNWRENEKVKHILTPININFVKVNPTDEFREILEEETNKRLKEQYSDHMILGLNYSYVYSNQTLKELKNFEYFRANIETSGNLLYGFNSLLGIQKSPEGYYNFLGVRYSQYIRLDFDFRQYYKFQHRKTTLATRYFVGFGVPYLNSDEIPYERGFYAGGANGMRGWGFRTLGPGSYSGTDQYEKIGDIQLEFNIEYRFPIYKFFHGGAFADFGNIWTYNESETFPGGQFNFNDFYKEMAADIGLGFRFDFQFFIFRIDFAAPIVNPAYAEGERWRFDYLQFKDIIGNFGIGYPF